MVITGDGYTVTWSASPLLKLPNVVEEKRKPSKAREDRLQQLLNEDKPRKPALKKATTRSKTMPLKKSTSKKAFEANIKTEAKTKPIKQAVAIAYAVKKTASKKATKK